MVQVNRQLRVRLALKLAIQSFLIKMKISSGVIVQIYMYLANHMLLKTLERVEVDTLIQ